MRLAVILPSRGLVFSKTIEEVLREVRALGCEWEIFFAHSRPIPQCFNEPITTAMAGDWTHYWLVEEDMVFPVGVLAELVAAGRPVVACDYPMTNGKMCVLRDGSGVVRITGTGCLLAERDALASVLPFRTDIQYWIRGDVWTRHDPEPDAPADLTLYGMHDIHMGMTLYDRGTPIHVIDTPCSQRVVSRFGAEKQNHLGWHDITELEAP